MARQGFTLIQISILLVVASLTLVAVLPSTRTALSSNRTTTSRLNAILVAMRGYEASYGMLPCPADASQPVGSTSYGVAAANPGTSGNCMSGSPAANYADAVNNIAIGMVPVRALGLSNEYALDAFGRDITYAVDTGATVCGWTSSSLSGKIVVTDNGASNNSLVALVSHGVDGHGAWIPLTGSTGIAVRLNAGSTDSDQLINAHVDTSFNPTTALTNFVRKTPTGTFDDLVVYKSALWNVSSLPANSPKVLSATAPANGTYISGQRLSFTLTYSAAVTVNTAGGTPYLSLSAVRGSIGTGNIARAAYVSGSGTPALTFSYTIAGSDSAPSGLTMASSITLDGGLVQSGNFCPALAVAAPDLSKVIIGQYIYVADTYNNRVEVFGSNGGYLSQFGSSGTGNGQFNGPISIAIDASGDLWVVDLGNSRLEKFDYAGNYISQFGSSGTGNGQFNYPISAAIDGRGNIWVLDGGNARVQEFSGNGTYVAQFGSSGNGNGQFGISPSNVANSVAQALAIDSGNNIFVADTNNNRVEKFSGSGVYVAQFGSAGLGNGQFSGPQGIGIDAGGNVWVADLGNCRVEAFSNSGSYLGQFGSCGSGNGQLNWPTSIFSDGGADIWVVDGGNARVQEFSGTGTYITQFGASGGGNGQFGINPSPSQTGITKGMAIGGR
jgi:sugar lactone lactonase YvrE